jgi:flagellin
MVINTNTTAARGARFLENSTGNLQKSLARLASGSKIVEPQDDAAGLAVATRFDAQINRTEAIRSNIGNAISFKQTQDGYLSKVSKALDRMSELSTLAQDGTKSQDDVNLYEKEFNSLGAYITDIESQEFNSVALFDNTASLIVLQNDADGGAAFESAGIGLDEIVASLGAAVASGSFSAGAATQALADVKLMISSVAGSRAQIGADLSRLMMTNEHLSVLSENLQSSVSRIKDVDVASESARYAKYNILVQSGTAMLAQANSLPQSALRLLQ